MKFFAFLMTIILIAQSFMPCADREIASAKGEVQITKALHHEKGMQDDCPPLCSCSCCGCFSSAHSFTSYISINSVSVQNCNAEYLPESIQKIVTPIWQPPQL